MDKDFYTNDFERLLRDKTDEFKMYPSESVWTDIYNKLHPGRKWGIIGGSVLLLLFTASVLVLRTNNKDTVIQKEQLKEALPVAEEKLTSGYDLTNNADNEIVTNTGYTVLPSLKQKTNSNRNNKFTAVINSENSPAYSLTKQSNWINETGNTVPSATTYNWQGDQPASQNIKYTADDVFLSYIAGTDKIKSTRDNNSLVAGFYKNTLTNTKTKGTGKIEWQLYFTPSVSYRALFNNTDPATRSFAYNSYIAGSIDKAVNHTPALGFEIGNAFMYAINKSIKIKAGVQFNYSKYNIRAYSSLPELTTIRLNASLNQGQSITVASSYKTYGGYYNATTIASQNTALSFPVGVDMKLIGNNKISWAIAGTLQPTLILNNKAYIVTNDLKHYVSNADVFRNFVMNSSLETYLRFEKGNGVALQIGPQLRYQISSSYTSKYAISEHLLEYGVKVGIIKRLSK
jgi:hypothetical protein